jgi:hypothetical protein
MQDGRVMSLAHSFLRAIGTPGLIKLTTPNRPTRNPTITITTFTSAGHLNQTSRLRVESATSERQEQANVRYDGNEVVHSNPNSSIDPDTQPTS